MFGETVEAVNALRIDIARYALYTPFPVTSAHERLLARTDPEGTRAAAVAKHMIDSRRHATYWDSTRDTALAIEALAEYLVASGEGSPDMTVEVLLDGVVHKTVRIAGDDLLGFDDVFAVEGAALGEGRHTLENRRRGSGPLYASAAVEYFAEEEFLTRAGEEVKVERTVFRLRCAARREPPSGSPDPGEERYERVPLRDGDTLATGDLVEVEMQTCRMAFPLGPGPEKHEQQYLAFLAKSSISFLRHMG